jgi:zinc transporter ZupT
VKRPEGYLNLIANSVHVTLEGLAIGAIFANGNRNMNISYAFAVVSHVIPQEIGDTSMLLFSGFSIKEASIYNGLVKCSSLLGSQLGYWLENDDNMQYILSFVAGNFIYLSCIDLLPLIVHEKKRKIYIGQGIFFLLGVMAICFINLYLKL